MRPFNDWEIGEVSNFIGAIRSKTISLLTLDTIIWKGDSSGCYSVKASYYSLEGVLHGLIPPNLFWNRIVPAKIGFFAWKMWWGKVLKTPQLKKRGFI